MTPRICAVDTSGRLGSIALAEADRLLDTQSFRTDYNHAVELLPVVERLCRRLDWKPDHLEEVYVSAGPGSFTGLRIAVTMARALALSLGVRIVAVPTLDVVAQNALRLTLPPDHLGVILDAKRKQVYAACFELRNEAYHRTLDPAVFDPVEFVNRLPKPRYLIGSGIHYHRDTLSRIAHQALPEDLWGARAESVHRLGYSMAQEGGYTPALQLRPIYLRRPEAEELWDKRRATSKPHQET